MRYSVLVLAALFAGSEAIPGQQQQPLQEEHPTTSKPPNFLFILTDDQDLQLNSPAYMPHTLAWIKDQGVEFQNHFVTTALCCPSRVSLWTGRQAHNTNVTDVHPPYGGYPKFVSQGFNDNFLPVWLQSAGYNTFYTGKLFNAHSVDSYNAPFVNGFNGSDFLLDPYTYSYWNSTYQRNQEPPRSYEGHYTTDVITDKALGFLEDALQSDSPFFLTVAPIAPHTNVDVEALQGIPVMTEPLPAPRHAHLFPDAKVPRTPHFNPAKLSGASWVRNLELKNQSVIDYEDHLYRQRLRALQGVDELVDRLLTRLAASGEFQNTYIIYSADNGYHIGQHRLPPGKTTGYEEDIRVPFYIRGPGLPRGVSVDRVTTHIDIAPTLFELAGIPLRTDFDGTPMPVARQTKSVAHEHVTVEYWGRAVLEGEFSRIGPHGTPTMTNNTYKSARILSPEYNLYYSVWCNNDHELYDLSVDPYQMNNIYSHSGAKLLGRPLATLIDRIDALLLVLKSCQGRTCIEPWKVLHPSGNVRSLKEALDAQYDKFYAEQPKVSYSVCEDGYLIEAEGPQAGYQYRDGLSWEAWT
ncbi:sulfatase family protein [Aspergillus brunneoviolaceus CBS 621.78]|uniref:Arylsulphatase n=1 Tax=Aspergillus brunneoviolaceus CBS 621.78 TaxID=1450534 RepID=A0ACD1G052_9EURO|nr:Arylsulphatase [Aspergillus brunneoviolaceus CBS 621.78]RAH42610.1 Arylsulphatase [Aspergillus brunneoviolaceus CBS 621.78]